MNQLEKVKWLEEYAKSLEGKTEEELKEMEKTAVAECEAVDKEVAAKKFKLPTKGYDEIAQGMRMLLNKQKVTWQYTLGLVAMYDFWETGKKAPKEVPYPMLDQTLRTLGEMQFEGYTEWTAVVAINKYFEPIRQEYMEITEKIYDASAKHNSILDKLALFENVAGGEVQHEPQPSNVEVNVN